MDDDFGLDKTMGKGKVDLEHFGATSDPKATSVRVDKRDAVIYMKISYAK